MARASLVDGTGKVIYDEFVKATEKVSDYRTHVSGVRAKDMRKGVQFKKCQRDVANLLKGRILVGHALHNDLKALELTLPRSQIPRL